MSTNLDFLYYPEPITDIRDLLKIFLASLADKSKEVDEHHQKIVKIPENYKNIIENIMYMEEGQVLIFSKVINIGMYYYNQEVWENMLDQELKKIFMEKKVIILQQSFEIRFTETEIEDIFFQYDEETLDVIDRFSELFNKLQEKKIIIYGETK